MFSVSGMVKIVIYKNVHVCWKFYIDWRKWQEQVYYTLEFKANVY